MGKQTGIKFVPTLTFVADIVPDTARELEEALERARHADAELARAREGARTPVSPTRTASRPRTTSDDDLDTTARHGVPELPMTVPSDVRRPAQERTVSEVDPDPHEPGEGEGRRSSAATSAGGR